MQFKHPEILYALFLLLIPIIVHLFQLRKFEKVAFTNVQFLKKIELQTRKSSKLKKLLTLLTRILLFASLIIAFAQPFTSSLSKNKQQDTYIYLDNSLSMQAPGNQGELLKRAVQEIIETNENNSNISLLTNNNKWSDLSSQEVKNQLLSIDYHPIKQELKSVLLQLNNSFKNNDNTLNNVFLISDFQDINNLEIAPFLDSASTYNFVQLAPQNNNNISIDSAYIFSQDSENITLNVVLKSYNKSEKELPISIYNDQVLLGKATTDIEANSSIEIPFTIPFKNTSNGKITIEDSGLNFDNELYFTLHKDDYINVLSIGEENEYLQKIYTSDEFILNSVKLKELDYGRLNAQNLILLNELENIPTSLANGLLESLNNGNDLVIIPNVNTNLNSYINLFKTLRIGTVNERITSPVNINFINFSHPFLKNVFENKIDNFQYPNVQSYMRYSLKNSSAILKFENDIPFISQINSNKGNVYVFASAISAVNSNFKNSPLIVPIFYNFGKYSFQHSQLNYTIGSTNEIEIKAELQKDDILLMADEESSFIPRQVVGNNSVKITTSDMPLKSGSFIIKNDENIYRSISYNYDRSESQLSNFDLNESLKKYANINYFTSVKEAFITNNSIHKTNNFWQLCLLAALLFLIFEVLILKFLKS